VWAYPIFKIICDREVDDRDLASQPTLSRFENAIGVHCFSRLSELLLDRFIARWTSMGPVRVNRPFPLYNAQGHRAAGSRSSTG